MVVFNKKWILAWTRVELLCSDRINLHATHIDYLVWPKKNHLSVLLYSQEKYQSSLFSCVFFKLIFGHDRSLGFEVHDDVTWTWKAYLFAISTLIKLDYESMTNRFLVLPQFRRGRRRSLSYGCCSGSYVHSVQRLQLIVVSRLLLHMSLTLDTHRNQKRNVKPK